MGRDASDETSEPSLRYRPVEKREKKRKKKSQEFDSLEQMIIDIYARVVLCLGPRLVSTLTMNGLCNRGPSIHCGSIQPSKSIGPFALQRLKSSLPWPSDLVSTSIGSFGRSLSALASFQRPLCSAMLSSHGKSETSARSTFGNASANKRASTTVNIAHASPANSPLSPSHNKYAVSLSNVRPNWSWSHVVPRADRNKASVAGSAVSG